MKKLLLIISIFALVLLPIGCMGNIIESTLEGLKSDYMVKVSSNVIGLNVTGEYQAVFAVYNSETGNVDFSWNRSAVEGQIPPAGYIQYTADDAIAVVGWFQKLSANATLLRVEVWSNGDLIDWEETTDPWGVAAAGGIA
jgi:hypothetical protein